MARGNKFNKKAWKENWYRYNEVTLENGKRLDSYTPPMNGVEGMIVSRKATNLEEIELSSFESYLKEMKNKDIKYTIIKDKTSEVVSAFLKENKGNIKPKQAIN